MSHHPAWGEPLENIQLALALRTDIAPLREAAFQVINALQHHRPSAQIEAAFLAAVTMSEAAGMDAHALVERALRQLPDAQAAYTDQVQAIGDYVRGELRR